MKHLAVILSLLLSLAVAGCGTHKEKDVMLRQAAGPANRSVYFLRSSRLRGSELHIRTGMAVAVGHSESGCLLMTSAHLVNDAESIGVRPWSGEASTESCPGYERATTVFLRQTEDFALLSVRGDMGCKAARIADNDPLPGEPLVTFGQPAPEKGAMTRGIVSGYWKIKDHGRIMVSDILTTGGFSGSGVFLDDQRLAGLVSGKTKDARPGFAYIIPAGRIGRLIGQALAGSHQARKQPTTDANNQTTTNKEHKEQCNDSNKHDHSDQAATRTHHSHHTDDHNAGAGSAGPGGRRTRPL